MTFKELYNLCIDHELLIEKYVNLFFDDERKSYYANTVWDMLQRAYEPLGGIKGNGFSSISDMVQNIPFWKLVIKGGKIKVCMLYKDKNGRKLVAVATDFTKEGKMLLIQSFTLEFERAYTELSHSLLKFVRKNLPDLVEKYKVPVTRVQEILAKTGDTCNPVDEYIYTRNIGGEDVEKMMFGTIDNPIKLFDKPE
jgi:hypothetical protein